MITRDVFLVTAALLFGLFEIYNGFAIFRKSRFHFYWIGGLLIGLPFIAVALLTLYFPRFRFPLIELGVFVTWIGGEAWKRWRKKKAQENYPELWDQWEKSQAAR